MTSMTTNTTRTRTAIVIIALLALMCLSGCGTFKAITAPPEEITPQRRWANLRGAVTDMQDIAVGLHQDGLIDHETFLTAHSILAVARGKLEIAKLMLPEGGPAFDRELDTIDAEYGDAMDKMGVTLDE